MKKGRRNGNRQKYRAHDELLEKKKKEGQKPWNKQKQRKKQRQKREKKDRGE